MNTRTTYLVKQDLFHMTEVVIFQLCGTPRNVHLEAHSAALPLSKFEHHFLVSSGIPWPTYNQLCRR